MTFSADDHASEQIRAASGRTVTVGTRFGAVPAADKKPMRLHTLPARLLQLLAGQDGPISYVDLGERLGAHPGSIKRLADEMVERGWLTTEKQGRIFKFTIAADAEIEEGGTLGDWLERNADRPANH